MAEAQTYLSKCISQKRSIYSNRTVSNVIVLLELLTVLLEYIDLSVIAILISILLYKYSTYYASIMLNAFRHLLCSQLCQHNRRVPNCVITSQYLQLCKHNLHQVCIYLLAITECVYTFLIPKISPVLGSFSRAGNNITGGSNRVGGWGAVGSNRVGGWGAVGSNRVGGWGAVGRLNIGV